MLRGREREREKREKEHNRTSRINVRQQYSLPHRIIHSETHRFSFRGLRWILRRKKHVHTIRDGTVLDRTHIHNSSVAQRILLCTMHSNMSKWTLYIISFYTFTRCLAAIIAKRYGRYRNKTFNLFPVLVEYASRMFLGRKCGTCCGRISWWWYL